MQLDFVEMLRVRDEKRRMRHVEALRRQKELEEDKAKKGGGGGARSLSPSEQLQDLDEDQNSVFSPAKATSKPHSFPKPDPHGPPSSTNDSTLYRQVRQCHLLPFSRVIEIFGLKCGHFHMPDVGCDRLQPSIQHRISGDGSLMDGCWNLTLQP